MSERKQRTHQGHLYRDPGPDREALSINDWYGHGVLMGLGGQRPETVDDWHHWYCGKAVALDQYKAGYRHGRQLRVESTTFEEPT
jgi:hypothetical protein